MRRSGASRVVPLVAVLAAFVPGPAAAGEDDVLLEFHLQPAPHVQIAIWLEDADGAFVQDVFVTQATGTLGIGNRPGRWDFLSSWRFPYGPRPQVLPVWAHRRGHQYPALVFHDDDDADLESLGWHENTSSGEPYYCRPLTPDENVTIATDTMTCPSPAAFHSDKGRFTEAMSPYPPRADLTEFDEDHDHIDVMMFGALNDLDVVTGATPRGDEPTSVMAVVAAEDAAGPLVAWIEVNLEHDENPDWDFDRDVDHFVDPRLSSYGDEYKGQPSVVYRIEFDPAAVEFTGTDQYAGYGEFDGGSGEVYPPDASISTSGGSGADRLALYTLNDETFRFGVYSHGPGSGNVPPEDPGWGSCAVRELPAMVDVELEPVDFDTVRVHYTLPSLPDEVTVRNLVIVSRVGTMPLTEDNAASAIQTVPAAEDCDGELGSASAGSCDLRELFGNHDYQVGVRYEDTCGNRSVVSAASVTTPAQKFAQVDGACFIATAAHGAPWVERVQALRWMRDRYLKVLPVGAFAVQMYYSYGWVFARNIENNPLVRSLVRVGLLPFTNLALVLTAPRPDAPWESRPPAPAR